LKKIVLKYNFHLAIVAALAINVAITAFPHTPFTKILILNGISFFSTLAIYNYYRKNSRPTWLIPLLLASVGYFLMCNESLLLFALNILICLLYQSPFPLVNLRRNAVIKPMLIALCWVNTILLLPWFSLADNPFQLLQHSFLIVVLLNKWLLIFCLCLITDLTQTKLDRINGLSTFPVKYGIKTTKWSIVILSGSQLMLSMVYYFTFQNTALSLYYAGIFILLNGLVLLSNLTKFNKQVALLSDVFIGIETLLFFIIYFLS